MNRFKDKVVLVTGGDRNTGLWLVKKFVDEDVKFVDGMMYPSDRPGLGIELNEEAAAKHPKADHWLRHYVGTLTNVRPPDSAKYFHS